jgi:hypothetical protein
LINDSRKSAKEGKGEEQEGSERGKVYIDTPEQNHCEKSQGSDGDSSESYYEYFYVRHYDPELRKKQKLERKKGIRTSGACDGKIDHMVEEKTIRPDIVQKYDYVIVLIPPYMLLLCLLHQAGWQK